MIPVKNLRGGNITLTSPVPGAEPIRAIEDKQGEHRYITTGWQLSPEERQAIGDGCIVLLTCMGAQPPVHLRVGAYTCAICGGPVVAEDESAVYGAGQKTHRMCLEIRAAGQTEEEKAAERQQLLAELLKVMRDDPDQIEIRPDVFAYRSDVARCFEERRQLRAFAAWAMGQFQGDSGAGDGYWEQHPEYCAGRDLLKEMEGRAL